MRLLRQWLGLDTPPVPPNHDAPLSGDSDAETLLADAVQGALQALDRVDAAHRRAADPQRQSAIAAALLRARRGARPSPVSEWWGR